MSLLLENTTAGKIYSTVKTSGWSVWMPRPVPSQGRRHFRQTCSEILPAHVNRDEESRGCRLLLGLVLSRLVAPPLQPRVVGPYLVRGVWFLSCLPLEGTSRLQII
jgi:hypothetical protein